MVGASRLGPVIVLINFDVKRLEISLSLPRCINGYRPRTDGGGGKG